MSAAIVKALAAVAFIPLSIASMFWHALRLLTLRPAWEKINPNKVSGIQAAMFNCILAGTTLHYNFSYPGQSGSELFSQVFIVVFIWALLLVVLLPRRVAFMVLSISVLVDVLRIVLHLMGLSQWVLAQPWTTLELTLAAVAVVLHWRWERAGAQQAQ